ncbi:MAG: YkvA family protein, partial [Segetibacter sp.]
VLMIAYKDKRTPVTAKILIGITVGYLLSPIDLIPDFIPVLGLLDDLIIVPALIALSIKLIPETVLNDAREKLSNNPLRYKKNNWIFACIIILIWLLLIIFIYRRFNYLWNT